MCQVAGIIAAMASLLTVALGALSQIRKNYKEKSCKGLSLWLAITSFFSFSSWFMYGALKQDWFLILSQTPGAIAWLVIMAQFKIYKR